MKQEWNKQGKQTEKHGVTIADGDGRRQVIIDCTSLGWGMMYEDKG